MRWIKCGENIINCKNFAERSKSMTGLGGDNPLIQQDMISMFDLQTQWQFYLDCTGLVIGSSFSIPMGSANLN